MAKPDYLNLRGKKYRVEVTFGALRRFCEEKGVTDLSALDNENYTFDDMERLAFYCLSEGATFDNKELDIKREEIASYMRPVDVRYFMAIFKKQSVVQEVDEQKKRIGQRLIGWFTSRSWKKRH